jgi:hypothetical protein
MKHNPLYQSGQPLVKGRNMAWKFFVIVAVIATIALIGGFLGTGLSVQANTELQVPVEESPAVTPSTADNSRDLADEVRTTVICPEEEVDEAVCIERTAGSEDTQIPVTGEE